MNKTPVTAIILAFNAAKQIEKTIASVGFCDEIIVIDDESSDNTAQVAQTSNARVIPRNLAGDFAGQRNFAMEKARNEWVLFIDSDEQVTLKLQQNINEAVKKGNSSAFYIKRRDFWWGKELRFGEVYRVRESGLIRLMKKTCGTWKGTVHEQFHMHSDSILPGTLEGYLDHYPHVNIAEFIADVNRYSDLRALELFKSGAGASIGAILLYPMGKFIRNYFVYLGFLDGPAGFAYSFVMSFHSFLVRAKLYQYIHIEKRV